MSVDKENPRATGTWGDASVASTQEASWIKELKANHHRLLMAMFRFGTPKAVCPGGDHHCLAIPAQTLPVTQDFDHILLKESPA